MTQQKSEGLVLGLDVGSQSIGWALIDSDSGRIVATGVRIFPEGVDRDQTGGEKSKSQTRRTARGMRRQIARRRLRKRRLRLALQQRGLLPSGEADLQSLLSRDPIELRCRALDQPLTAHELGRVLLHLARRRGFQSNRKEGKSDSKLVEAIDTFEQEIKDSGCRTLGEYQHRRLAAFDPGADRPVRGSRTRRSMYREEFDLIWNAQRQHHPDMLTEDLRTLLDNAESDDVWMHQGLIFGQRRMYWPKSIVGRCELIPQRKRCERADRRAQSLRMLEEVNNLRLTDMGTGERRKLTDAERRKLLAELAGSKELTFDKMRELLDFGDGVQFNLERGDRKKLKGHETDYIMRGKAVLGKDWDKFDEGIKNEVIHVLLNVDVDALAKVKLERLGLTGKQADAALWATARLPQGRASYSIEAAERLLPHLERGLLLMANDPTDSAIHAAGFLRPDERVPGQRTELGPSPDIANPIVRQALVEVRRVVNAIVREYGRPTAIHIELARDSVKSFGERAKAQRDQRAREAARDEARAVIEQHGLAPRERLVRRYLLWQEQGGLCVYTGRQIGLAQLFDDAQVDVDHILPRWRSLDDSMMNKVVCFREANAEKADRTPAEWLESDPERFASVLGFVKAAKLPYPKRDRFLQKNIMLDDFVARQLTDTAYISRLVFQYLAQLGCDLVTPRGGMTAELRRAWGLNNILGETGEKNRADHRHHAVDAAVIALTSRSRLKALADGRGKQVAPPWPTLREDLDAAVKRINVSYRVQRKLSGALHEDTFYGRTQRLECGPDGVDTAARPHAKGWIEDKETFVRRKPVSDIKNAGHLEKVRDSTIRAILAEHVRRMGGDPEKGAFPKGCFEGANTPRMPNRANKEPKEGQPNTGVPIKRVRMLENSRTIRRVSERRRDQYVKPGNNHSIAYFAVPTPTGERWEAVVTPMIDAARRVRGLRLPPVAGQHPDKPEARFLFSLCIGEMFEMNDPDGNGGRVLCTVRKMDASGRVDYKTHTDARPAGEIVADNLYCSASKMQRLGARKLTVDPLGRTRWAND
ncbi:MAG: type II CRISPR RNA-guided endonuclease Cas9 [Leptolyngbya sp. PLA3]|nr:MAG: type II CRISPR RNA-guided endonuclease Cas9 [Cyanobacteria bacterium CYA]MCE7968653.1 type II CRISPR RNA-guided endonuclease Cas9 [Leptolyngbya sp. PL-A3]